MIQLNHKKLEYFKDLLFEFTKKEIKVRYKNSFLGYLWSILNPLSFAVVFSLAFKIIMKVEIENYSLFLIVGLFPWQLFSNSVNASATAFINNASLIKKTAFPREIIIYSLVLNDLMHFLASIPVIVLFLLIYGKMPSMWWLAGLLLLIIVQFLLVSGIALIISSINLFFRDLERLVGIVTNLLFYLTPIVYSLDMISKEYQYYVMLNPIAPMIIAYRDLFLYGVLDFKYMFFSLASSVITFIFGYIVYNKLKWRLAEVL